MNKKLLVTLVSGSIALMSGQVLGQGENEQAILGRGGIDEIIVTARKREESLQSVPVSVAVVSSEQLENNLASDLTKIAELAPQMHIGLGGAGTGGVITIRGVSSASSDAGIDQSVAIELDGVPVSRGWVMTAAMFDLENVQVLQGPQALFFGKNSPAGVISIRSANPTDYFEGYIKTGYEFNAKEKYIEGAVSGPLTETLKARFAFRGEDMKGWMDNTARPVQDFIHPAVTIPGRDTSTAPEGDNYAGRLTLEWTPA